MTDDEKTREQLLNEIGELRQEVAALKSPRREGAPGSEDLYRALADSAQDVFFIVDREGYVIYVNPFGAAFLSADPGEIIGKKWKDLFPTGSQEHRERAIRGVFETGFPFFDEEQFSFADRGVWLDTRLIPIRGRRGETDHILCISRDTTSRKKAETELGKIQKLESLAVLAGSIVHEFNNVLTAIVGNILLAKMYAKPSSEVFEILTEAEKASQRAGDLTRQLLAFSKGGTPLKKTLSIRETVANAAAFVSRYPLIAMEFTIPDDLWAVEADEFQIRQALHNMIENAIQAMPEGGTISIRAKNMVVDASPPMALKTGQYVRLSIEDTGVGIDNAHMERIFDPFFTTRNNARGLGLTGAYSIIRNHEGRIGVESDPASGTVFHIYLPAGKEELMPRPQKGDASFAGRRQILVMDDEEIVRTVLERMLNQCSCDAQFAEDGSEMIGLYRRAMESGNPFDAVIVDLIVSEGMGGKEAVSKLLEMDPRAKAILSSGYSDDSMMSDFRKVGAKGVLPKPFSISDLSRVLREVLSVTGQ